MAPVNDTVRIISGFQVTDVLMAGWLDGKGMVS